jgi:hypothetical protein
VRTTITLEQSLFEALKKRAHERDVPFKRVVNDAIRLGLDQEKKPKPYSVKTRDLGEPKMDVSNANRLADQLEDEEILRKVNRG